MKRKTPYNLTQARLFELVHYSPDTGIMVKLNPRPGVRILAPGDRKAEYMQMSIDGRVHLVHRLAWLYMTGSFPAQYIDHKDGDTHNNRFDNLRECSHSQNCSNGKLRNTNTSGIKGVRWVKRDHVWRAVICKNYKRYHLGQFQTKEEAAKAYRRAAKRMHKEFARA